LLHPRFRNQQHRSNWEEDCTGRFVNNHGVSSFKPVLSNRGSNVLLFCQNGNNDGGYSILSRSMEQKNKRRELTGQEVESNLVPLHPIREGRLPTATKMQASPETDRELAPLADYIRNMKEKLGYGKEKEEKRQLQRSLLNRFHEALESSYSYPEGYTPEGMLYRMKKQLGEMERELSVLREQLRQPIRPSLSRVDRSRNRDDQGLQFSKPAHVYELIRNYAALKNRHFSSWDDIWAALTVLDELIRSADLNPAERLVIDCFKAGYNVKEILQDFNKRMGTSVSDKVARHLIQMKIPNKLAAVYVAQLEQYWIRSYQVKGKTCRECRLTKLKCDRNLGRDPRNRDGFKGICKHCEKEKSRLRKKRESSSVNRLFEVEGRNSKRVIPAYEIRISQLDQ
jgi:hypothetical protein